MDIRKYKITEGAKFKLDDHDPADHAEYKDKDAAKTDMKQNIKMMRNEQDKLYAHDKWSLLLIFQAMDAAGKDGLIKHVMSGINPQGTQVFSFKQPSKEELDHDYLWRINKALPERGRIGIFNRSYYEDVLVVKVHNLVGDSTLPKELVDGDIWDKRYKQIVNYEEYLYQNGIIPLKFFLHVSKEEQKKRFLSRIDDPSKNWKFSQADVKERGHWDEYMEAYEDTIRHTASDHAPWHVIPADHKWFSRMLVSEIVVKALQDLPIEYPVLSQAQLNDLQLSKQLLLEEK